MVKNNSKKIKAAIAGSSGYTGLELLKLLAVHPHAETAIAVSSTYGGISLCNAFPSFYAIYSGSEDKNDQPVFTSYEGLSPESFNSIDVVFTCLPATESMEFVRKYLGSFKGVIIDIGSDFRLNDPQDYLLWYGKKHALPDLLGDFVYGLPELNEDKIKSSKMIANPGCYPTSVLLALAPLFLCKNFKISEINIDTKSGVSGAGKKLKEQYLFSSLNENFYAYSPLMHRHTAEIEQELSKLAGEQVKICFTPHLLPLDRGIFSSIYCKVELKYNNLPDTVGKADRRQDIAGEASDSLFNAIEEKLNNVFSSFYKNSAFVKFIGNNIPGIKDVAGTNMCFIGFSFDYRTGILKIFSVLDNLLKGAAGQAVQNMNIVFGYDQKEGLH